jgi:hypothetical protein
VDHLFLKKHNQTSFKVQVLKNDNKNLTDADSKKKIENQTSSE